MALPTNRPAIERQPHQPRVVFYHRVSEMSESAPVAGKEEQEALAFPGLPPAVRSILGYTNLLASHDSEEHGRRSWGGGASAARRPMRLDQSPRLSGGRMAALGARPDRRGGFRLVICTETSYRRFRGHEQPGLGRAPVGRAPRPRSPAAEAGQSKFVPVLLRDYAVHPGAAAQSYVLRAHWRIPTVLPLRLGTLGTRDSARGLPARRSGADPMRRPRTAVSALFSGLLFQRWFSSQSCLAWRIQGQIRLDLPTSRLELTVAGDAPKAILAPAWRFPPSCSNAAARSVPASEPAVADPWT
jgi:hypothetical protein